MSEIKLSGKLAGGDSSGLAAIAHGLIHNPANVRVLIALVDCKSVTTDQDTGDTVPTARVRRIECVRGQDLAQAEKLLRRALGERSGEAVLPLDLEDELSAAFADVDPNTGEARDQGTGGGVS